MSIERYNQKPNMKEKNQMKWNKKKTPKSNEHIEQQMQCNDGAII